MQNTPKCEIKSIIKIITISMVVNLTVKQLQKNISKEYYSKRPLFDVFL